MNPQTPQSQQQQIPSQQLASPPPQLPGLNSNNSVAALLPTIPTSLPHVISHLVPESAPSLQQPSATSPWGVGVNVGIPTHHGDNGVPGMPSHHHEQVSPVGVSLGLNHQHQHQHPHQHQLPHPHQHQHHEQVHNTISHHHPHHDSVNPAALMQGLPQGPLMGVPHSSLSESLLHHTHHHEHPSMGHLSAPQMHASSETPREMQLSAPSTPLGKHSSALSVGLKQEKAHIFFNHYLVVGPHLADNTLSKSIVYALYRRMMPEEFRYDFANFSNALYDWAYLELIKQPGAADAIEEAIRRFEVTKQTKLRKTKSEKIEDASDEPPRKRQRKKKTAEDETKDKVKNILRNSQTVPFVALKPVDELDPEDKFAQLQPDHVYSAEQLHEWELSPGTDDFKQSKNVKISLPYAIKEDDTQYVVFVNVPFFPPSSLTAWATNTQVVLEGTITLPPIVDMPNKQVDVSQLTDVDVPRHNQLHLGKFRQVIDLPKPISPPCCVLQESGLVIVGVDKQVFTVNKTIL